jgi:hypothetical protein
VIYANIQRIHYSYMYREALLRHVYYVYRCLWSTYSTMAAQFTPVCLLIEAYRSSRHCSDSACYVHATNALRNIQQPSFSSLVRHISANTPLLLTTLYPASIHCACAHDVKLRIHTLYYCTAELSSKYSCLLNGDLLVSWPLNSVLKWHSLLTVWQYSHYPYCLA